MENFDMYVLLIFFISLCSRVGSTITNITSTQFLTDSDVIISSNNRFKLGFFSPPNSTNRYVGVWFNFNTSSDAMEVVWVANKGNPLKDSSGVLQLSKDANLRILDRQNNELWSSNVTLDSASSSSWFAQLQDSGNLVLSKGGVTVWQSFEHPTDSILPLMGIGVYDEQQVIRSWKSPSDPSSGRFTLGMKPPSDKSFIEVFIWDDGKPYWRTGPWNGNFFIGLPVTYKWGSVSPLKKEPNSNVLTALPLEPTIIDRYVLTYDGFLVHKVFNDTQNKWETIWSSLESECDVYGKCGSFGICNPRGAPVCSCLEGFEPTDNEEWSNGNWTGGCSRRTPLECGTDEFLMVQNVKVPDNGEFFYVDDEIACMKECQQQCSCLAYAWQLDLKCLIWNHTLVDIQAFNISAIYLFIRLAHSDRPGDHYTIFFFLWTDVKLVIMVKFVSFVQGFGEKICKLKFGKNK